MKKDMTKTSKKESPAKQIASESVVIQRGSLNIHVSIDVPYLTPKEYARRSGQSVGGVSQQVRLGKLPIKARAEGEIKVLINNAALFVEALVQEL